MSVKELVKKRIAALEEIIKRLEKIDEPVAEAKRKFPPRTNLWQAQYNLGLNKIILAGLK